MQQTRRWDSSRLIEILQDSSYLRFYHLMNYPVPRNWKPFMDTKNKSDKNPDSNLQNPNNSFSRDHENALIGTYLAELENHSKLYQSLPFVDEIYLCNSITFNALHKGSDIDFFIITRDRRIRTAKFFAMIMMLFTWTKRFFSKVEKKICLSFFVSSSHQNLYSISTKWVDIYLTYRIAHLVPLYLSDNTKKPQIRQKNKRIKAVLPNFPLQQSIFLWNQLFTWKTGFKRRMERNLDWIFGDIIEFIFKYIQLFIIFLKRLRQPHQNRDVITTDQMLKFHKDIRAKVSLKYSVYRK